MSNSNTWRVQYFRDHSPHPVSHYYRGKDAEAEARARAAELRQTETARGVTVDRIERPAKGRGRDEKTSAKRATRSVDRIYPQPKPGSLDD